MLRYRAGSYGGYCTAQGGKTVMVQLSEVLDAG